MEVWIEAGDGHGYCAILTIQSIYVTGKYVVIRVLKDRSAEEPIPQNARQIF